MRSFEVEESLEKVMNKLAKRDKVTFEALKNKINEILTCKDVSHYKNLKSPLNYLKRVHVRGSFVLVFRYVEGEDKIIFYDFDHHDFIYE